MELRCYVVITGDEHLKELVLSDVEEDDPHYRVQQEAIRRTGRDISRGTAKAGVFGRIYGRGLASFMRGFRLNQEQGTALVNTIDKLIPSISIYNKQTRREIHSQGYLESYFHRRRRFIIITDENKNECYRQGVNFKVQSMASDINLFCMLHLYAIREKTGACPLFPVHDSIVFDIESEDCIPIVKKEIEEFSSGLVNGEMQFKVKLEVGPNWGETKEVKV